MLRNAHLSKPRVVSVFDTSRRILDADHGKARFDAGYHQLAGRNFESLCAG